MPAKTPYSAKILRIAPCTPNLEVKTAMKDNINNTQDAVKFDILQQCPAEARNTL